MLCKFCHSAGALSEDHDEGCLENLLNHATIHHDQVQFYSKQDFTETFAGCFPTVALDEIKSAPRSGTICVLEEGSQGAYLELGAVEECTTSTDCSDNAVYEPPVEHCNHQDKDSGGVCSPEIQCDRNYPGRQLYIKRPFMTRFKCHICATVFRDFESARLHLKSKGHRLWTLNGTRFNLGVPRRNCDLRIGEDSSTCNENAPADIQGSSVYKLLK